MPLARKKMGKLKKGLIVAGTVAALGAGATGLAKYHAAERKQATQATTVLRASKSVRNAGNWGKICAIYNWNPTTPEGARRIKFIETVSKNTNVEPERIMNTIETNYLDKASARSWNARLISLKKELSTAQRVANIGKGFERRRAATIVKNHPDKIAQANRVLAVLGEFAKNSKLSSQIQSDVLSARGSHAKMKKLSERK